MSYLSMSVLHESNCKVPGSSAFVSHEAVIKVLSGLQSYLKAQQGKDSPQTLRRWLFDGFHFLSIVGLRPSLPS